MSDREQKQKQNLEVIVTFHSEESLGSDIMSYGENGR